MRVALGTIALELNRWSTKMPSYRVSEWLPKIKNVGFDGLELWENHVLKAEGELQKIKAFGMPITVYNTYAGFTDSKEDTENRTKAVQMIHELGAGAVKYNVGNDKEAFEQYRKNLIKFAENLPESCVTLCECHGGTLLED